MKKFSLSIIISILLSFTMIIGTFAVYADDTGGTTESTETTDTEENTDDTTDAKDQTAAEGDNDLYGDGLDSNTVREQMELHSFGYSDISDDVTKKAAGLLGNLDILNGYDDGTFKPNDKITRYDFACAVFKLQGIDLSQQTSGAYVFRDVENGSDIGRVMSAAVQNGYLLPDSTGAALPHDGVKADDAIKIAVKISGYEPTVKNNNYASKANSLKLLRGVETSGELTRADAARLLYNTATAPYFKMTSYGDKTEFTKDDDITLLSEYHDVYSAVGCITATHISAINDYGTTSKNEIRIDSDIYTCTSGEYNDYLGINVEYFYTDKSGRKSLVFAFKDDNVKELVISADNIDSYSKNVYKYYENGKAKTAKITSSHNFIYNGVKRTDYTQKNFIPKNGYIRLVSNGGSSYENVFVWEYYNVVLENIFARADKAVMSFLYGCRELVIDVANDDISVDTYVGGKLADVTIGRQDYVDGDGVWQSRVTLPAIPRYTLISVYADKTVQTADGRITADDAAKYYRIMINTETEIGSIASEKTKNGKEYVTINKKTYEISTENFMDKIDEKFSVGSYGTFRMDCSGKIASWTARESSGAWQYGYLINAKQTKGLSPILQAKLLCTDETIRILDCTDNIKVNGVKCNAEEAYAQLAQSAKMLDPNFTISQIVRYRIGSGGKITDFEIVTASNGVSADTEKSHLRRERDKLSLEYRSGIGGAYIVKLNHTEDNRQNRKISDVSRVTNIYQGEPDVFFHVPMSETFDDDDYWVGEWLPDNSTKSCELYDVDDTLRPHAVVVYDSDVGFSELKYPYILVTEVSYGVDNNGKDTAIITGYAGANLRSYYTSNKELAAGLKEGDFIAAGGKKGIMYDYDIITNIDDIVSESMDARETSVIAKYSVGTGQNFCAAWEPWEYVDATRGLIVQRGALTDDDNKRSFQKISWFMKSMANYSGIIAVDIDRATGKKFYRTGTIGDIKGARDYGHNDCSRVYLVETSNYTWRITIVINYV